MSSKVLVSQADGVLELTLNRPDKKNALDIEMYEALTVALLDGLADPTVRVVLFAGAGGAFTSGNDLVDFMQSPPTSESSPVMRFLSTIATYPKPMVAAVQGAAVGIGTTLLLHCDLAYASETALFKMPFVQLGLVPEAGSSLLVPALVGHRRATELLVLGEKFGADEALRMGFVNAVVPTAELLATARTGAARLAALPPEAVRQTKALLRAAYPSLKETLSREGATFIDRLGSPETAEAITAFLEKRTPDFSKLA